MLTTKKKNRSLFLLTSNDLVIPTAWTEINTRLLPCFLLTLWWTENFLARPNPNLGRAGPVCPFIRHSLDKKDLWLTAIEGAEPELESVQDTVLSYKEWFLELPSASENDEIFKTILILFPDIHEGNYHRAYR